MAGNTKPSRSTARNGEFSGDQGGQKVGMKQSALGDWGLVRRGESCHRLEVPGDLDFP